MKRCSRETLAPSQGVNVDKESCATCFHWLDPLMGRGWCGRFKSHPLVMSADSCDKWSPTVDRPKDEEEEEKELDFIQDSDPGDEA